MGVFHPVASDRISVRRAEEREPNIRLCPRWRPWLASNGDSEACQLGWNDAARNRGGTRKRPTTSSSRSRTVVTSA